MQNVKTCTTFLRHTALFCQAQEAVPEIVYAGHPVLRNPAQPVGHEEAKEIAEQLKSALLRFRGIMGFGRGLAAPQIGVPKAVFVTYVNDSFQVFLNPKILERSQKFNFYKEICLSAGLMAADMKRPEWILMSWEDENGLFHEEKFEGFLARLYQHEEAHLRGEINIDHACCHGLSVLDFDPLQEQLRT